MLSQDEPLHARARKMTTSDDNTKIRYEGDAVLWQGANRIQADVVDIDRDAGLLKAHGHVVSQLLDKKNDKAGPVGNDKPPCTRLCVRRTWSTQITIARLTTRAA